MGFSLSWYANPIQELDRDLPFAAGGGAYYLAKRSVKADRSARHEEDMKRRMRNESLEQMSKSPRTERPVLATGDSSKEAGHSIASAPNQSSLDPLRNEERSKYAAKEPYRRKPGDRFS